MRVLVTGASGTIGRALCDALFARGDDVVGLTREPGRARQANPRVTWHKWEPTLERPDPAAFEGVDGVVHLLGERIDQRWTDEAKRADHGEPPHRHPQPGAGDRGAASSRRRCWSASRRSATTATAATRRSTRATGRGRASTPRSSRPGRPPPGSSTAQASAWSITRTGQVLSAEGGMLKEMLTPFKLGVGGPLAGGDQYLAWIHIDDEIGILLWALDNESVSGVDQRQLPQPGDQQGLLQGPGPSPQPPRDMPVPGLVLDLKFGNEFGQVLRGGAPRDPEAHRRARLRVQLSRPRRGSAGPALALAGGAGDPLQTLNIEPWSNDVSGGGHPPLPDT